MKKLALLIVVTLILSGCTPGQIVDKETESNTTTETNSDVENDVIDTETSTTEPSETEVDTNTEEDNTTSEDTEHPSEDESEEPSENDTSNEGEDNGNIEDTPVEDEPVEEKPTYTFTELRKTMWVKSSVNVRDLPTSSGNKLGQLAVDTEVVVTGQCKETNWYRIEYKGGVGYVSNTYLISEPAKPKYTITEFETPKIMFSESPVTVRDIPSSDGKNIGKFNVNSAITTYDVVVLGQCNETKWYQIKYNGGVGYVDNESFFEGNPYSFKYHTNNRGEPTSIARCTQALVELRALPSENGELLITIEKEECITHIGSCAQKRAWAYVEYKGVRGYIYAPDFGIDDQRTFEEPKYGRAFGSTDSTFESVGLSYGWTYEVGDKWWVWHVDETQDHGGYWEVVYWYHGGNTASPEEFNEYIDDYHWNYTMPIRWEDGYAYYGQYEGEIWDAWGEDPILVFAYLGGGPFDLRYAE